MTIQAVRHARYMAKRARSLRDRGLMEMCSFCKLARINVIHEENPEHAPEGADYYADLALHRFIPTGFSVDGHHVTEDERAAAFDTWRQKE